MLHPIDVLHRIIIYSHGQTTLHKCLQTLTFLEHSAFYPYITQIVITTTYGIYKLQKEELFWWQPSTSVIPRPITNLCLSTHDTLIQNLVDYRIICWPLNPIHLRYTRCIGNAGLPQSNLSTVILLATRVESFEYTQRTKLCKKNTPDDKCSI